MAELTALACEGSLFACPRPGAAHSSLPTQPAQILSAQAAPLVVALHLPAFLIIPALDSASALSLTGLFALGKSLFQACFFSDKIKIIVSTLQGYCEN